MNIALRPENSNSVGKIWNEIGIKEKQIQGILPLDRAGHKFQLLEIRRNIYPNSSATVEL